jgi:hypothetical protein
MSWFTSKLTDHKQSIIARERELDRICVPFRTELEFRESITKHRKKGRERT